MVGDMRGMNPGFDDMVAARVGGGEGQTEQP